MMGLGLHDFQPAVAVAGLKSNVALGIFADVGDFHFRELANNAGGRTDSEGTGRNLPVLPYHRTGADDTVVTNLATIKQDGSHADQAVVANGATMQGDVMPHGDVIANHNGVSATGMHHRVVLNIASLAEDDWLNIATQNRPEPNTRLVLQDNTADYRSALGHMVFLRQGRGVIFESTDHAVMVTESIVCGKPI